MTTLKCGEFQFNHQKDSQEIRREFEKVTCTKEEECKEGDKKVQCQKRTVIGPSKEDPNFFLGAVACLCPSRLEDGWAPRPKSGERIPCGETWLFYSKNKEELARICEMALCTDEKTCGEGEDKKRCVRRTLIRASKEDEKFFMAMVACICPDKLK